MARRGRMLAGALGVPKKTVEPGDVSTAVEPGDKSFVGPVRGRDRVRGFANKVLGKFGRNRARMMSKRGGY